MHYLSKLSAVVTLLVVTGLSATTASAQTVAPQRPHREAGESTSRNTIGWIVAGVGGASLLGSGFVVIARQQKLDQMRGDTGADITRELQPYDTAATALFAVGVVGVGVGLPLALIGADDAHVALSLDRVALSGTF